MHGRVANESRDGRRARRGGTPVLRRSATASASPSRAAASGAASFGLGALQYLQHVGLLGRVRYLSTVSGGSYIGAAVACAHTMSGRGHAARRAAAWARASVEEEYLRKNLGYLAPGSGGRVWFAANILYGLVLNLLPLLSASFLVGRLLGVLYRALHPELDRSGLEHAVLGLAAALLLAVGVTMTVVVGIRRLTESCLGRHAALAPPGAVAAHHAGGGHVDLSARLLTVLVVAGGLVGLVLIVIPVATIVLADLFEAVGLGDPDVEGIDRVLQRVAMGSLLIAVALALGGVAMLLLRLHRVPRVRSPSPCWRGR